VERDAAIMIKDEMVKARLFAEITSLAKDKIKQQKLSKNIAAFAVKNADKKIAEEILKTL
jgi:UDP-N-acetylglucosamine--N-acetylmuramyl-(pentapeptide) pyrophosphoryl-undecaprenol N-acetylglucosamine transferase